MTQRKIANIPRQGFAVNNTLSGSGLVFDPNAAALKGSERDHHIWRRGIQKITMRSGLHLIKDR